METSDETRVIAELTKQLTQAHALRDHLLEQLKREQKHVDYFSEQYRRAVQRLFELKDH